MELWQRIFIVTYALINLFVFKKGWFEIKYKKNAFGLTRPLAFLGIFVWGDALIFGIFWLLVSGITLLLNDWYLFLLILSVFWAVRSIGETVYWLNEQFSKIGRNPPQGMPFGSFFPGDSVWFIMQIIWQCITVISIIFSIYFAKLWLDSGF